MEDQEKFIRIWAEFKQLNETLSEVKEAQIVSNISTSGALEKIEKHLCILNGRTSMNEKGLRCLEDFNLEYKVARNLKDKTEQGSFDAKKEARKNRTLWLLLFFGVIGNIIISIISNYIN